MPPVGEESPSVAEPTVPTAQTAPVIPRLLPYPTPPVALGPQESPRVLTPSGSEVFDGREQNTHRGTVTAQRPTLTHLNTAQLGETTPLLDMHRQLTICPEDTVYSYFLFVPPVHQRRTQRYCTALFAFAVALIVLNFLCQTLLLYVVGKYVEKIHGNWVSSIVHLDKHAWYQVAENYVSFGQSENKCVGSERSLCWKSGDQVSCGPHSVNVLHDWRLLDKDGDGIWTRDEAFEPKLREQVQCDHGVDLGMLYELVTAGVNKSHALDSRRNPGLLNGTSLHKAYVQWYMHKPLLCMYGDEDMCGTLFRRGFFDKALERHTLNAFKDTHSALMYCNNILQHECLDMLPNTYKAWRMISTQQCGIKEYEPFMYHRPAKVVRTEADKSEDTVTDERVEMLAIDFKRRKEYEESNTWEFKVFLMILLFAFLSSMLLELKNILKTFAWTMLFPGEVASAELSGAITRDSVVCVQMEEGEGTKNVFEIKKVRRDHRWAVFTITSFRFALWVFLLYSGIMFLTSGPKYLELIFDSLSLLFIIEIDELLYKTMLRHELKVDHEEIREMRVVTSKDSKLMPVWIQGFMGLGADAAATIGTIALAGLIVLTYTGTELNPLREALSCLCMSEGSHCMEAHQFNKAWWDKYWGHTLPTANRNIDLLMGASR